MYLYLCGTLWFVKVLNVWLLKHLLVVSLNYRPLKLKQGPCKDRLCSLKIDSVVLKTLLCSYSLSNCSVLHWWTLSSMTAFLMWHTFAYTDRPNNIPMSKTHHHFMRKRSALKYFGLIYPLMHRPKERQQLNLLKLYMISHFSNKVETSGLWPHLDWKYFLNDFSACCISLLLCIHQSLHNWELSFGLSKIWNYCAE